MIKAHEVLQQLREGNRRFLSAEGSVCMATTPEQRRHLVDGQSPFAVVLGCSDSRVPIELIFDQGPGCLFVIRVAGNIVAPSLVGSVEFAAARFGTRLVVVLGHSGCGAVSATLSALQDQEPSDSPHLHSIVERISPAITPLLRAGTSAPREVLMRDAVRANIRASAAQLPAKSTILQQLIANEGLLVVGAEYDLGSGRVDFFHGVTSEG